MTLFSLAGNCQPSALLMFLAYLDESGTAHDAYMVVGGLLVHEQDAWPLSRVVDEIANRLPSPMRGAELHTSPMRSGRDGWRDVPYSARRAALDEIAGLLRAPPRSFAYRPVLFAVAMHNYSNRHHDPVERLYEEFFARCNGFLGREASLGNRHRCIPIADKSDTIERRLQNLVQVWRARGATTGAQIGPLAGFAEVPVFVDSRVSRIIQLADFVCNTVYRYYSGFDAPEFEAILPAFDSEDGRLHGLTHLVGGYRSCPCPACESRR